MTEQLVVCDRHGERPMAFVCQHIAQSLFDQKAVGFFWSQEDKSHWPDAWCSECVERLKANNYEWEGSAAENLGAKVLCGDCYDEAASASGEEGNFTCCLLAPSGKLCGFLKRLQRLHHRP